VQVLMPEQKPVYLLTAPEVNSQSTLEPNQSCEAAVELTTEAMAAEPIELFVPTEITVPESETAILSEHLDEEPEFMSKKKDFEKEIQEEITNAAADYIAEADEMLEFEAKEDAEGDEERSAISIADIARELAEKEQTEAEAPVVLIADPFLFNTLEVAEAQDTEEVIIEDDEDGDGDYVEAADEETPAAGEEVSFAAETAPLETQTELEAESEFDDEAASADFLPPEASDAQLENLAVAMAIEESKIAVDSLEMAAEEAALAAQRLAAEIAEDEALVQALAEAAEDQEAMDEIDPELQAALPSEPLPDADGNLDLSELMSCIEALLFMSDKPLSTQKLHELLGPDFKLGLFQEAITQLRDKYQRPSHGIELVEVGNAFQFRTKQGRAALAKKLAKTQTQRLSGGAMETLAIVAYRQPVLKDEIDKIRGVDSSYFIRGLMDRKLIKISGRSELPGRPMLYSTTQEFLELFALKDLSAMPSLREIEQMVPASQSANPEDLDPRVREMRRLVGEMKADTSTSLVYNPREDEKILKDIRERVNSIPTSTPYLEELKAAEEAAKHAAQQPPALDPSVIQPELTPQPEPTV